MHNDEPYTLRRNGVDPDERGRTGLDPAEEPVTTGTLFLMIVFLMLIFGFWALMYNLLLER